MIKIMADSTCDLSQDIVDKYKIGIVPLNIIIDGTSYKDKIDITPDEFFNILPNLEKLPTTSMRRLIIHEPWKRLVDSKKCKVVRIGI